MVDPTLLYFEAIALIVAALCLALFASVLIAMNHIAMHRNVLWLIAGVIVTNQLYIAFRLLTIIFQSVNTIASVPIVASWLPSAMNIGRVWCSFSSTIDSITFVVERLIASVLPKTYEHYSQPSIVSISFAVVWCVSGAATAIFYILPGIIFDIIVMTLAIALLLFGVLIFIYIFYYNRRKYAETYMERHGHTLSERYQISENIRITRELMPFVVSCLLRSIIGTILLILLIINGLEGAAIFDDTVSVSGIMSINPQLIIELFSIIVIIHAIMTPILIIAFNPKLCSKCKQIILHCGKSQNTVSATTVAAIRFVGNERQQHFQQLKIAWN